jgi:hypothetical protein
MPHEFDQDALKRMRMQALMEALANGGIFRQGSFFAEALNPDALREEAFRFAARDFGRWNDKKAEPNPERTKALATCRQLKALRDGSTFPGEKRNAQDAMDKLQARHGIKDGEI